MKIVHIACVAPPLGGGIGQVAAWETLLARQHGAEAWLATPNMSKIKFPDFVCTYPAVKIMNSAVPFKLVRMLEDADIVHLHYPFYGTAEAVAFLKSRKKIKRLAITLHMDADVSGWRGMAFDFHRKFIQDKVLDTADILFVSSLDYASNSSYAELVHNNDPRLHELPFGVDTEKFSPGVADKPRFGIPPTALVVGTVSVMDAMHPFKGIDVLLDAFKQLSDNTHLLLVGDGDRRSEYESLAKSLGLAGRVHFAGRLDDDGLVAALRSMDIFAFPSTGKAEAFGLAMLEAMSVGIPVVASDLPGVRKVAQGAGATVSAGDVQALAKTLQGILGDLEGLKLLGISARAKAENFSWKKHGDELMNYYKQLCVSPF